MKKTVILILLLVFNITVWGQTTLKVGTLTGQEIQISDISKIKNYWKEYMEEKKFSYELTSFYIERVKEESGAISYLLIGSSKSNDFKIAIQVFNDANVIYLTSASLSGGTVTCSGCTVGCTPRKTHSLWACEYPCSGCSKTETVPRMAENTDQPDLVQEFIARY